MRPLEIALVVGLVLRLLNTARGRGAAGIGRLLTGLLAALLVAHLIFEGARLPMAPAYVVTLGYLFVVFLRARQPSPPPVARGPIRAAAVWLGVLALLVLVAAPPYLLPVFRLPTPTGPHPIGVMAFQLADASRPEAFSTDPAERRTFMVRVWYPAPKGTTGKRATYYDAIEELLSPIARFPKALVTQYGYVRTHGVADAPVASDSLWPVLVFSHGYTGYSSQNTPQVEELASRGYVVFSITHTYDATAAVFPNGRVVRLDPKILTMFGSGLTNPDSVRRTVAEVLARIANAATPEDRRARFKEYLAGNSPARIQASVPVWAADTRFLLDHLGRLPPNQPGAHFAGHLDLNRIGIFGMSFGGSNAGQVCLLDRRCKAGLNIDGQQFGSLIDDSLSTPFMILASETAFPVHRAIYDRFRGPTYLVTLKGTQHIGLTDLPYWSPLLFRKLGVTGTMRVERSEQLMTDYVTAFFDTYLKGQRAPILSNDNPADDVAFLAKNR